jgi:hypothetical protein
MPRIARVVIRGCLHHVTQRGNLYLRVTFADFDRDLGLLRKYFIQFQVDTATYALMPNHPPSLDTTLGKLFGQRS